jgi:hypothetical protein
MPNRHSSPVPDDRRRKGSPMGYTTDFLGHIEVHPPLNGAEVEYLTAFSQSRRWDRPGGPYAVPDNPRLDDAYVLGEPDPVTGVPTFRPPVSPGSEDRKRFSTVAPGQPQLYCQWAPCPKGCCLSWDGGEKFYEPTHWMRWRSRSTTTWSPSGSWSPGATNGVDGDRFPPSGRSTRCRSVCDAVGSAGWVPSSAAPRVPQPA